MSTEDRARSYAEAFYEAALERWIAALDAASGVLARDRSLLDRAQVGQVEFSARRALLDSMVPADADPPVHNLLYALAQRGDLSMLPDIAVALRARMGQTAEAATRVEIISALPLTETETALLTEKLAAEYGSGLEFQYRVDPAILGGLIVRVGDKLIDGSVASRLAAMKQALGVTSD
jgi:F-type H+-transporting ATPase subunit delta